MDNKSSSKEDKNSESRQQPVEEQVGEEEEYVLLDLDSVSEQIPIPPNAPYVLSGLDTPNPILTIDGTIKLIGEYEETIGTCIVFKEGEADPVVHVETGTSEANLFMGRGIVDTSPTPAKRVDPITSLHRVLRFRVFVEGEDGVEQ